ncbi:hypothetical protein M513_13127 [Trichuris suis]|uniref:Uncharacterized protein n=1 Tax=Trichuris suis TaxID=68888 RepID=A0A085LLZ9_9BILA|nr:hypothetical protein M513_13127 [Trichuris suis]
MGRLDSLCKLAMFPHQKLLPGERQKRRTHTFDDRLALPLFGRCHRRLLLGDVAQRIVAERSSGFATSSIVAVKRLELYFVFFGGTLRARALEISVLDQRRLKK